MLEKGSQEKKLGTSGLDTVYRFTQGYLELLVLDILG